MLQPAPDLQTVEMITQQQICDLSDPFPLLTAWSSDPLSWICLSSHSYTDLFIFSPSAGNGSVSTFRRFTSGYTGLGSRSGSFTLPGPSMMCFIHPAEDLRTGSAIWSEDPEVSIMDQRIRIHRTRINLIVFWLLLQLRNNHIDQIMASCTDLLPVLLYWSADQK